MKDLLEAQGSELLAADSVLKVTSLLYLEEALGRERYEECAELIFNAKKFGASSSEVSEVIVDYLRNLGRARKHEAKSLRRY